MEKVLVTGATGFIGRHLVPRLLSEGYAVHTIERRRTEAPARKGLSRHFLDFTDYAGVRRLVGRVKPQYAINLAGISSVLRSMADPAGSASVAYVAAINLAEACRTVVPGFKQFITAGSSIEYGISSLPDRSKRLTETMPLNPKEPYAIAKVAVEMHLAYLRRSYAFPYTVLRGFTAYGRDDNSHFIEYTIDRMLNNELVRIETPNAVRDWVYIDDLVDCYLRALGNKKAIGQAFNICYGEGRTVIEAAELIAELTGSRSRILRTTSAVRRPDPQIVIGDNSKARRLLGWRPKYSLEKGLQRFVHLRMARMVARESQSRI